MPVKRVTCIECERETPESLVKKGVCTECRDRMMIDARHAPSKKAVEYTEGFKKKLDEAHRLNEVAKELVVAPALDIALAAQKERARRELARRHLLPFVERLEPDYHAGWVHKDICERLEKFAADVQAGKRPRLMITMPPRHGKSMLASQAFPAWYLGRYPDNEIISCSYSANLSLRFSRKVRDTIKSAEYTKIFPHCKVDEGNKAAERWMTTEGGQYLATGIGGPATGSGFNVGILDDPIKNREEAESETVRESIKDWYTSVFLTRQLPLNGILIILTRWHNDDIAGWLLEQQDHGADQWELIRYPAIAECDEVYRRKGDPLHPQRYNLEALMGLKRAVGPRDWEALYQQNPVAQDGDYFKKSYFRFYTSAERPSLDELKIYQAWDLAIGTKEQNDYSVGATVGVDDKDNLWVLDISRVRLNGHELVEHILDQYELWTPSIIGIEKGHIEMALGPFLRKRIRERQCYGFNYEELKTGRRDKIARAQSIRGRMMQGMVRVPKDSEWTQAFMSELLQFPLGKHDDQVDAFAWIGQLMDQFSVYVAPRPKPKASWRDKLKVIEGGKRSAMSA